MRKFIPVLFFFTLVLISLRTFLLSDRLIGHNWDFTFPYPNELFTRIDLLSKYAWLNIDLGSATDLTISHLIPNAIISTLGKVFGSVVSVKILLITVLIIAFIGYKKLLDYLKGESLLHYLFAFLFAFSPFLFNEFIGGSWYMWISYAAAPYYFVSVSSLVLSNKWRYTYLFIISSFFLISSLQNFFCLEFILVSYLLFISYQQKRIRGITQRVILYHLVLVGINLYWIINFIISYSHFANIAFTKTSTGNFFSVQNSLQSLPNILMLSGYLDRNMYFFTLPIQIRHFFILGTYSVWFIIFYSIFLLRKKNTILSSSISFWLALLLFSVFFVKGGNIPFSIETIAFFQNIPFMALFRSPQHLMFFPAFIVPILIAYTYEILRLEKKSYLILIVWCSILIWTSGWFLNGDLGRQKLTEQKRDRINLFSLPIGLQRYYRNNWEQQNFHRVLFLPSTLSPVYKPTVFQDGGQGGVPEYLYLNNPTVTAEKNIDVAEFELIFCKNKKNDYFPYIQKFAVKEIILRRDVLPIFTECKNIFDANKIEERLKGDRRLELTYRDGSITIFTVKSALVRPAIFSPSQLIQKRFTITSYQVSPVEHSVNINRAPQSFDIIYLSNFNYHWQLNSWPATTGAKGYGNKWKITMNELCKTTVCTKNLDNTYSAKITMYFSLQKYLNLGLILSAIVIIGSISALHIYENSKKKS